MATCAPNSPSRIYVSQSHFYGSPAELWKAIEGMAEPTPSNDRTYVDVEPISGVIVDAQRRSQLSLGMIKGNLPMLRKLPNIIVPMIWLNVRLNIFYQ